MRDYDRAYYICCLWHQQSVEQRLLLSDVPYDDLCSKHRSLQMKEAMRLAKGSRHVPLVVERKGKRVQIW